jgi:hypothetical protein
MSWHRFLVSIPFTMVVFLFFMVRGYHSHEKISARIFWISLVGALGFMALANLP